MTAKFGPGTLLRGSRRGFLAPAPSENLRLFFGCTRSSLMGLGSPARGENFRPCNGADLAVARKWHGALRHVPDPQNPAPPDPTDEDWDFWPHSGLRGSSCSVGRERGELWGMVSAPQVR